MYIQASWNKILWKVYDAQTSSSVFNRVELIGIWLSLAKHS